MTEMRYIDAIGAALRAEMTADPGVVVLGEDVSVGGPFGATAGLAEEFGGERVLDTPISEATVMGLAVGAAATGIRPVVEVMFIDFITLAMDQLVNHAAKLRYMSGGRLSVPLTVRTSAGAAGGAGAHHSQSLESWFLHVPGLKVVAPSTPADAYGLLRAAIRDDDPVLFVEHRNLYWTRGEVDLAAGPGRLGEAAVVRSGTDVTVAAASGSVPQALAAADVLEERGIDVEVVDLRTLAPLDDAALLASVRRTRRLVVAHEAPVSGGFGAEVAARVQEQAFGVLAAPIGRVGAPFTPVPASLTLEQTYLPGPEDVVAAVERVVRDS
jgi:pyruvate dehydrogenase E1 component beta subunit